MLIHDFIYTWDGTSQAGEKPISWWPGSYHVKIIQLSTDDSNVRFLLHHAVLLKNAKIHPPTKNTSIRNYIHTFAHKISKTYQLDMEKTLWIDVDDTIRVTRLKTGPKLTDATLFDITWRNIRPNELKMVEHYLSDM